MAEVKFRNILVEYANSKGGGLPLTPEEMCNATVQWVQSYVTDRIRAVTTTSRAIVIDVLLYGNVIKGSETIIVDIAEDNESLEIHLDSEVVAKLDRAVLTPLAIPNVPKVPVLGVDNAVVWEPVDSFVEGKYYKHIISITSMACGPNNYLDKLLVISKDPTPFNSGTNPITVEKLWSALLIKAYTRYETSGTIHDSSWGISPYVSENGVIGLLGVSLSTGSTTINNIMSKFISDEVTEL